MKIDELRSKAVREFALAFSNCTISENSLLNGAEKWMPALADYIVEKVKQDLLFMPLPAHHHEKYVSIKDYDNPKIIIWVDGKVFVYPENYKEEHGMIGLYEEEE